MVGGVAGPGNTALMSAVTITNNGSAAQADTLTLLAADGTTLGTWTSASIPVHGTVTMTGAALAAGATPVVVATTANFTVSGGAGLALGHLSQPKGGGVVTDLQPACKIGPASGGGKKESDDNENDGDSDN
jgi:hypothetical protein